MSGAIDTTAFAMISMGYLLAKHEGWQARLRHEALGVSRVPITYEDTKGMELGRCAWNESLRLFPIAPYAPRQALRCVEGEGLWLPEGTRVLAMLTASFRDPALWSEPTKYDPDRFSSARAEDRRSKGLFLPFGAGAHSCIGQHLATAQALVFWHVMLTQCRWRLDPDYEARHTFAPMGIASGDVELALTKL